MIKKRLLELEDELINLRRDFHQHPELGYQEFRTSDIVFSYLKSLNLEVEKMNTTGVVALLKGKYPGKTIMLRADLDAIPQVEVSDVFYKSKNDGVMHGCGHDGHMAMLLIAAKILIDYKDELEGNVKFVFQPNEEEAGALDMIKEGVLENPTVDLAFAQHIWTPIESGKIGIASGPVMAALDEFELEIVGRGGHTGTPHTAVDTIIAASMIVQNIQALQTRMIDPLLPNTIMVGKFIAGRGRNIVADKAELGGTIRYLFKDEKEDREKLLKDFERIVKCVCTSMNVGYNLRIIPSNPALQNHDTLSTIVRNAGEKVFGKNNIVEYRCMAGEDFAEFSQVVPSFFYFIGTGNKEKGSTYPHHHPKFQLDESTLKLGAEMHVRTVLSILKKQEG